ncbi:MAG TPA: wax ester/triacylglycerol synthase domain-containing protein [Frankiaceae bacterium]|nr:wax ester/triacylglycerol synthase domain-containing protein [Frankiaceae bacterium]
MSAEARRMSHSDAWLWWMESDPRLHSTIMAISMLDGAPDWDYLRARVDQLTRRVPAFRERVLEPPGRIGPPRLALVEHLELDRHLRRMPASGDGGWAGVLDVAAAIYTAPFPADRPLWEFVLLEGLEGGRTALVCKLHHSLADGIGGMQFAAMLVDLGPEMPSLEPAEDVPPGHPEGALPLVLETLADGMAEWAHLAERAARQALPVGWGAVRHPREFVGGVAATATALGRMLKPETKRLSPLLADRGAERGLATLQLPVDDLRGWAHELGCSMNDAFVASVTGGMRRYHEHHDAEVGDLLMGMPISLRRPGDEVGGNRAVVVRFPVPAGEVDVRQRISVVRERSRRWRAAPSNNLNEGLAYVFNLLPTRVLSSSFTHVDFGTSNIPSVDVPVYLAGRKVLAYYPFGPTLGTALNVTLLSYAGTCFLGIDADLAAISDVDVLADCLRAGLDEVRDAATRSRDRHEGKRVRDNTLPAP